MKNKFGREVHKRSVMVLVLVEVGFVGYVEEGGKKKKGGSLTLVVMLRINLPGGLLFPFGFSFFIVLYTLFSLPSSLSHPI